MFGKESMHLKLDYILESSFVLYLKFLAVFAVYHFGKFYAFKKRSRVDPPVGEKVFRYLLVIGFTAVIGSFASAEIAGDGEGDDYVKSVNYNRGAIAFLVLVIPAVLGVSRGFSAHSREFKEGTTTSACDM